MKRKNYKKQYKRARVQKYSNNNYPEFLVEVRMLSFKDLKRMELIDSRTYRESIKKKINSDYQGGNADE